jgi:hypothetical protein
MFRFVGPLLSPSFIPSEIFSELDVLSRRSVSLRRMPVVAPGGPIFCRETTYTLFAL